MGVVFCALQKSYFPLVFVFAPDQKAHTQLLMQFIGWIHVIEFSYEQSNNVSRNYIVIGTRYFVTQTCQCGVATL